MSNIWAALHAVLKQSLSNLSIPAEANQELIYNIFTQLASFANKDLLDLQALSLEGCSDKWQ